MQTEHCAHLACATQLELAQPAPLFDPANHLLDAAAGVDRLGVALVAGCTAIDGGATRAAGVLRHVRCHPDPPEFGDHSLGDARIDRQDLPAAIRSCLRDGAAGSQSATPPARNGGAGRWGGGSLGCRPSLPQVADVRSGGRPSRV